MNLIKQFISMMLVAMCFNSIAMDELQIQQAEKEFSTSRRKVENISLMLLCSSTLACVYTLSKSQNIADCWFKLSVLALEASWIYMNYSALKTIQNWQAKYPELKEEKNKGKLWHIANIMAGGFLFCGGIYSFIKNCI